MTDARLPSRWLTDAAVDGLSDRAWRTFTFSLMWCNESGTDGTIPRSAFRWLHPDGVDSATLGELVKARLWEPAKADVRVPDWDTRMGQSTAAMVARQREGNAKRSRQYRARQAAQMTKRDASRDPLRDASTGGQDRRGEDRQGQALSEVDSRRDANVVAWPVAAIPNDGVA
ncbi:hypothetical protein GCM10028798_19630 [Humibacter antri]